MTQSIHLGLTPLIESMASVLNLADKTTHNCTRNGFHKPQNLRIPFPYASEEKGNDNSNNSSALSTKLMEDARVNRSQEQVMQNCQSFPPQVPSFSGAPWPFPWNLAPWSSAVPPPAFCLPEFVPFYPAAVYWGFTVSGAWNIQWLAQPSSPKSVAPDTDPNTPAFGKHSRERNMLKSYDSRGEYDNSKENNKEKCFWVPKTLRIDDPAAAAKSSTWTTLGIKMMRLTLFRREDSLRHSHQRAMKKITQYKPHPSCRPIQQHCLGHSTFMRARNPVAYKFHESKLIWWCLTVAALFHHACL